MNNSENISQLTTALSAMQRGMRSVQRNAKNPFYHSTYADLAEIWGAIREPLGNNGLSITQSTDIVDGVFLLITTLWHGSGEWVACRYPIIHAKDDPQSIGSALQYAKRYSLSALVGVTTQDDIEDDDGEKSLGRGKKQVSFPAMKEQMLQFKNTTEASIWWKAHKEEISMCSAEEQQELISIGMRLTVKKGLAVQVENKKQTELTATQKQLLEIPYVKEAMKELGITKQMNQLTDEECMAINKKASEIADREG
ncbi:MAG: ERF family protein [bacterium]|nr:ERF family protein [bacterium]